MLYQIGTAKEFLTLGLKLPDNVQIEITYGLVVLDAEYGVDRDYFTVGGYSIIAQTIDDVAKLKQIIDYDKHLCEWATRIGKSGYISVMFIINEDYSVIAYMPEDVAPKTIKDELED